LDAVPLTEGQQWIVTSPKWERQLGDQEYQQLLIQCRGQILPKQLCASITVERVGKCTAKAVLDFSQQHDLDYNTNSTMLNLVRSETANAFVLPNNHIFVMTGLFQFARDEDELAAVLGHNMAHNLERHVGEKVWRNTIICIVANLMLLIDSSGVLFSVFLPTVNLLRELLPHLRIQEKETEANQIGMHLAALACYNPPNGAMHCRSSLTTHPSHDSRIQHKEQWLPGTRRIWKQDKGEHC
jgi:predicted Zn-dependent protease